MSRRSAYYSNLSTEELLRLMTRWVVDVLLVLALAFFLVHMLGGQTEMSGSSMRPTLESGDRLLVNRFPKVLNRFSRFDLIVYTADTGTRHFIRRIIALPGETVMITGGTVYINGEKIETPFDADLQDAGLASEPLTLGENEYFVLGDHSEASLDSRFTDVGNVRSDQILGRIWFRIAPFKRLGGVK